MKTIFSKVMWVGRATVFTIALAVIGIGVPGEVWGASLSGFDPL